MNLLKNNGLLVLISAILALGTVYAADKNEEEKSKGYIEAQKKHVFSKENITKRTAPVGKIFVEGDDVPTAEPPPAPVSTGPRSGEQVYTQNCSACHSGALPNAPALGAEIWKTMAQERGVEDLLKSAIAGTTNGMPPRGACMNCSDDELKAAIEHMINSAQ